MIKKMKENSIILVFISAVFVLAWYFYKTVIPNADDYGSLVIPYAEDMFGYTIHTGIRRFKTVPFTVGIMYKLFGMTEMTYAMWFATWFFICCLCTLYISVGNFLDKKVYLIPIFMYIFIPYSESNKYHFMSTAVSLLYFAILQKRVNGEKKLTKGFALFTILYLAVSFRLVDDYILLLIFLVGPILLYAFLCFVTETRKNQSKMIFLVVAGIIAVGLRFFDEIVEKMTGTGFFGTFAGYGGSDYTSWSTPEIIINNGIPSFIHSMLVAWNIPIEGGFIQLDSISWCIRVVILAFAWIGVIRSAKKILQGKIKEMSIVEAMATLSVLLTTLINIVNGTVTWDTFLSVRYASIVWFLLGAFAVWEIEREIENLKQKTISLKEYRISIGCVALSGILLFTSYGVPFFLPRRLFVDNEFEEHIQYMKEKDLHYGLGSFWYSTPITALSRGESDVMTINMEEDGYIAKGIGRSPQFSEMKNYCNFFLEDIDTPYGMTEERIVKNWGEYVEKKDFLKADEQPHSRIYSYDYDIRWLPVVVYEDIDFRKQKKWKISASMPLGKVRIVFEGSELQDISFSTDAECGMKLIENNNSKMVFELDFLQDTEVKLNLIADNQEALITKTSYYVVNAYQDVYADNGDKTQDAISFDLPSGEYFVFIEGDDIKDVEYTLYSQQDENIVLETQKGKIQQRLKVSVEQDTVVTLIGEKMDKIRRISYTNPCTSIPVELITIGALECYE